MKLKNFIKSFLIAVLLMSPLLTVAQSFKPATLYKLDRVAVYSESQAQYYFGLGYKLEEKEDVKLGVTIPVGVANFETSLVGPISATATSSMTLVTGTTDDGTTLNGTYGFVIDSGASNQEYVLATCVDTACSNLVRGISVVTGNTSVTALKQSHRRGASVKITDHPLLITLARILNGQETTPGGLTFGTNSLTGLNDLAINGALTGITTTPASSATTSAANVQYVNNAVVAGGVDASSVSKGITYLSSNASSSTFPIALNSEEVATTTGANKVVRASSTGLIDTSFINQGANYNFTGSNSFTGTTTLATTSMSVNPILVSNGFLDFSAPGTGTTSTTTISHNLGVTPYKIDFKFTGFSDYGSGYTVNAVGYGSYENATSSVTSLSHENSGKASIQYYSPNDVLGYYPFNTGNFLTIFKGSINSISTSTIGLTFVYPANLTKHMYIYWSAYGIRQ